MNRLNKTRTAFAERFEELKSYNADTRNIKELFEELLKLSRGLTEEELVIFDFLTRPFGISLIYASRPTFVCESE